MKNQTCPITRFVLPGLLGVLLSLSTGAWAADGEIVLLIGKAEVQESPQGPWRPARVQQQLQTGVSIRTGDSSQMAVVLRDQTQVRLNEQSLMRFSAVADAREGTTLDLSKGRMWAQAKQFVTEGLRAFTFGLATAGIGGKPPLRVQTPTATLGIRGTDWEVVADDDKTVVTVLSGQVDVSNDQGSVSIGPNEQASALRGQAPTKTLLTNARDRVQWVTAYRPDPRRWVPVVPAGLEPAVKAIESGDYGSAMALLQQQSASSVQASLLQADMLLFQGRADDAIGRLQPLARDGAGDPMAVALLSRALTVAGRLDDAKTLLTQAAPRSGNEPEVKLAQADVARLEGDSAVALKLFLEVAAAYPQSSEAWFGVGRIENEKENVGAARKALDEAVRLAPDAPAYRGERATVDTLAGDLNAGRAGFAEALKRQPDDYLALTGQGILQLKSGETEAALDSFLKAGVIEPRFARAQLYVGVAYYRLGNTQRAYESVRKAAELDPKDPLPYVMLGIMQGDALELGTATASAREAQIRIPYLKSLNQLLSDQKGSANLGASLANFGMEEWAGYYASQAYSPYWGASHLFQADRLTGDFNKNSELFKGYLTDPTAFGASNRNSSLVGTPGHYGRIDVFNESTDWRQSALIGTFNGMAVSPFPLAYFTSLDLSKADDRENPNTAHGTNFLLGLGAKPRYDMAAFGFASNADIKATIRTGELPDNPMRLTERRVDLGFNYKLTPENQFWFKAGSGRDNVLLTGDIVAPTIADALNRALNTNSISATGRLDRVESFRSRQDLQMRHAFTSGDVLWTWGAERSTVERTAVVTTTFTPVRTNVSQVTTGGVSDYYVSARYQSPGAFEVQGDLFSQNGKATITDTNDLVLLFNPPLQVPIDGGITRIKYAQFNPRLGVKWQIAPLQSLRLVGQKWRRPASAGSLSPIDTLGIAINDRLLTDGGLYERVRLQYDGEVTPNSFLQAYVDHERVDNPRSNFPSPVASFQLSQLQSLRGRTEFFSARSDLEESPIFASGTVDSLGFAVNHLLSKNQTVSARYLGRSARQSGGRSGLKIPYIPRHFAQLASQWSLSGGWLLGTSATFRTERFKDEDNLQPMTAGWSFGLTAYWEDPTKHHSVQFILDNVLARKRAGPYPDPHLLLRYAYRF